jgi:MFS family permease
MLSFGLLLGNGSPLGPILAYNLEWTKDENKHNLALITTAGNIGAFLGALIAKFLVPFGKRRMIILINIVLIVGICLTFIPKLENILVPLIIGKFLQGLAAGSFTVMCPALINELSPVELAQSTGALNQINCVVGIFLPAIMTVTVPKCVGDYSVDFTTRCEDPSTDDEFIVKGYWRVLNAIGLVFAGAQIILLLFCYNLDSPMECKQKNDN